MGQRQGGSKLLDSWRDLRSGGNSTQSPFAIERLDDREEYGEERFVVIGMAEGNSLLFVAYSEREGRIRIISARRATRYEQDDYFQQNA